MRAAVLARLAEAAHRREPVAVVTRLSDAAQCLVGATAAEGELALSAEHLAHVRSALASGRSMALDGGDGLFVRSYVPAPRLLIVGAVHISQSLAPMAAAAGFEVVVIDPRAAFASAQRFPGVELSGEWPDEAVARLGLDAATALVLLSHDPKLDDPALELGLRSPAFYIGALGSRRTNEKRRERMREAGLGHLLDRIHAPIGLDLGGRLPAEIAVSILAQVIQVRYRGEGR